jgi:hypothetical protein
MTHQQIQEKRKEELALRKEWNENILEVPETMKNFQIRGQQYLIRCHKFEEDTITDYGVINTKFKEGRTDADRPTASPDGFEFSSQCSVIQVSPDLENPKYKVGDVVWVTPQVVRPINEFNHNRSTPTVKWDGILKCREDYIEGTNNLN